MSRSVSVPQLEEYTNRMSEDKPDIVFLTGNIFEEKTLLEEMKETCRLLNQIDNRLGMYYIFGNHDPQPYTDEQAFTAEDIRTTLQDNGITVLEDAVYTIDDITIVGRVDGGFSYSRTQREEADELLKDVNPNNDIIMLDYRPLDLKVNTSLGVDLQLSGHTHGGQVFPMRQMQSIISDKLIYGERTIGEFHTITSSGISGVGYPIKTGAPSEYVIVDING